MSMPAQSSRTGTDSDSSLSLPTVTQATADNRLGKVGAGGWQLYRTHSLRLLRLSVRATVAHTRSRLCHATVCGVLPECPRVTGCNKLQSESSCCCRIHLRNTNATSNDASSTPPRATIHPSTPTPMLSQPPLLLGQLNVLSRTLSRSICLSVCPSVHLSVCPSDLLPPGCSIVLFLLLSTDLNEPQQRPAPSTRT